MTDTFKNWAADDRPVEKLMLRGVNSLSNSELLSIIVGGTNLTSAKTLLSHANNDLRRFAGLSVREILKLKIAGIGKTKAVTIAAAFELGNRRLIQEKEFTRVLSSKDIAMFFEAKFRFLTHEVFAVAYLNRSNTLTHHEIISEGGITGTVADPRIILKKALENNSVSIILCHNHPSGALKPSSADSLLTEKIKTAAGFLDIKVLDHVIVSNEGYFSFADEGLI